jgi:CheY-like chemotaxis protein
MSRPFFIGLIKMGLAENLIQKKESNSMSPKIVIIDDLPLNAELFQSICLEAGFINVVCFFDPMLAIQELKKQGKPDLIITDNNMPGMKGTEVLKKLEEYFGEINAVIITSDPGKVEFIGKKYPVFEKEIGAFKKLLEFLERNLKTD